jgi:hypothetical protein
MINTNTEAANPIREIASLLFFEYLCFLFTTYEVFDEQCYNYTIYLVYVNILFWLIVIKRDFRG